MRKMSQHTIDELNRVDQHQWRNELYILRHSPAARELFADLQFDMSLLNEARERYDENEWTFFVSCQSKARGLDCLAREVLDHHPWATSRLNPNRVIRPGMGKFTRLADELGYEKRKDEWGDETLTRTITGWMQA